jgi:hypothetical protein
LRIEASHNLFAQKDNTKFVRDRGMTQLQGWILIALITFGIGWFIKKDFDSQPTASERAMAEHERQMRALGLE